MQLLCPDCCSEEVGPHPDPMARDLRCANCGATFDREEAHVTVAEAEAHLGDQAPDELFELDAERARSELSDLDGAIRVIDTFADADELHRLLDDAQEEGVIRARRETATIAVYPMSIVEPDPLLAVYPGHGPTILGFDMKPRLRDDEDPVAFTIRILEGIVDEANELAAGRAADSGRIDRIAAFLNANRPWNGGDVCDLLASEILASGRRLLGAEE